MTSRGCAACFWAARPAVCLCWRTASSAPWRRCARCGCARRAAKAVLASHVSAEPAGMLLLDALRKKPLITAGMRLGEGTGAVAAMPLLDMARAVYMDCYTFEEGGIEAYTPQGGEG